MKYLIEFEFTGDFGNYYWFPLFLHAADRDDAEIQALTVKSAIEEHYSIKRRTAVQPIIEGFNAEIKREYIEQRMQGQLAILEVNVWRFKQVSTMPNFNFSEHLQLVEFSDMYSGDTIITKISAQEFPVRVLKRGVQFAGNEFLLVNVVDPSNVLKFYITVTMNETDFGKTKLALIQEGVWKDAHIKGYKVRVDAPHIPGGRRHVHIAHNKHINSKNKQVSWNDDTSRHDKNSFDNNFKGLEKAKAIARQELGLDKDTILESAEPDVNLLVEAVLSGTDDEIIFLQVL